MNPGIFLIQDNDELVEMNERLYDSEDLLKKLLDKYPSLLAGSQINAKAPRKWLLIGREFGVPSEEGGADQWSLDHLFLDQDAIPNHRGGETKHEHNHSPRNRWLQMLDYAANAVVYWPIDRIRSRSKPIAKNKALNLTSDLEISSTQTSSRRSFGKTQTRIFKPAGYVCYS